ncbi:MAG: SAM-dependent DNA methyltransferase [Betaproteobacteria bacterium]|nr:SAM-dependent DNA methyltransferase [Betaproteobacteria bacterium]
MLTGDLRNQIDRIWDAFWSGGISNPLEVIEQITYLLFLKRLDDLHTLEELKATRLKRPIERRVFPKGKDSKGRPYDDFRWSRFKNFDPREMFTVVSDHVFPFLRTLGGDDSTYAHHMKDARFTIPTPALLGKVVDLLDHVPMEDRDTKGDVYEYMLGKIASAGQNGQFRTPRHFIRLMVEMTAPKPTDVMCDPASGTCGFVVAVGEYLREHHPEIFRDAKLREHFHHGVLFGSSNAHKTLRRLLVEDQKLDAVPGKSFSIWKSASHPWRSSGGSRNCWTGRRHCGPSAGPPSPNSTPSPKPSSSTCSAIP